MKSLGLYLHIPFCRRKCRYCDFCSFPQMTETVMSDYVSQLCRDLAEMKDACRDYTVDTVFFGGGTPTLLPAKETERLTDAIGRSFFLSADAEITAECNPATADFEKLKRIRLAGINRLSVGVQSAQENELKALGRIHTYHDFLRLWEDADRAGFLRKSADLMFGIPKQTLESFADTLSKITVLKPEHLSVYSLIPEPGTPIGDAPERYRLPDEETVREMYLFAIRLLKKNGLEQYEISNFARTGCESRHNLKYWNQDPFLGLGVSAYSDFDGVRYGYSRDLQIYLGGERQRVDEEHLDQKGRMNEYVMLRMRLTAGLSRSQFRERFGEDADALFGKNLKKYISGGFVTEKEDGYAFTPEGMLVSNSILSDILDFS